MNVRILSQPQTLLGNEISELAIAETINLRIVFVSAFVRLRTILRLREQLFAHMGRGSRLQFTVGIDLNGTSREVLEELLRWNCEVFLFHNPATQATFHPKIYLFESAASATLFVGSNNLTDGGFYTNYEAAARYDFELPREQADYERLLEPLEPFIHPAGNTVQQLTQALIATLVARGQVPEEADVRRERRERRRAQAEPREGIPGNPFAPIPVPVPPVMPREVRGEEPGPPPPPEEDDAHPPALHRPAAVLVWRKTLPRTDSLQVNPGSNPVGGVRLTQAKFENPVGERIDQTTYFRALFADYYWEPEADKHADQEHAFVPMRIIIRGGDLGIRNFEISHKPTGESGQDNYTTILKWGPDFSPTVRAENLTGTIFSFYETIGDQADFLIDITDP